MNGAIEEMDDQNSLYRKVIEFHGHKCPGITCGFRVSLVALSEMGNKAEDEELVAIVENNSCAVDAIQAMTGCTFGKGNLLLKDYGKQAYTFLNRSSGKGVRIVLKDTPMEETDEEKRAWKAYSSGDRSREIVKTANSRRAKRIKYLMEVADEKMFEIEKINKTLPPKARFYPSVECHKCHEKVMEPKARIENGKTVCIPCAKNALP